MTFSKLELTNAGGFDKPYAELFYTCQASAASLEGFVFPLGGNNFIMSVRTRTSYDRQRIVISWRWI